MYEEVPEVSHVEAVMDGMLDSLSGNESLDLTQAQRYLAGVLESADMVRWSVQGTEGFFSSIGDGLKAAWDYVMKMFKSVYDFFFGKKNKEDSDAAKSSVKDASSAIKEVESPEVTEQNAQAVLKQVEKKIDKLPESAKKKELKKKVENAKADPAKAKAAAPGLIKEVYDESMIDLPRMNAVAKKFNQLYTDLLKRKDEYKAHVGAGDRQVLGHALEQFLNGFTGLKEPRKGLAESKAWLTWAGRCLEATDNSLLTIKAMKSEHEHAIKDVQAKIDGLQKSQHTKQELVAEIADLKRVMATIVTVIKIADETRDCIRLMAKDIESCCVKTKEN